MDKTQAVDAAEGRLQRAVIEYYQDDLYSLPAAERILDAVIEMIKAIKEHYASL